MFWWQIGSIHNQIFVKISIFRKSRMRFPLTLYCVLLGFVISVHSTDACKGCVNLDEYNFHKIISRFDAVLVKFDVAFPYGDKHDIFNNLATEIVDNSNFILAQVGIKDYGEKDNEGLGKKFGINSKEDLPALRLFVQGEDEPFSFGKNAVWADDTLKKFVRDHTNIYLGLPGCLEAFDKLAMKFSALTSPTDKETVLKLTENEVAKLTTQREHDIANTYIKFMNKVMENGASFIAQEMNRLGKIVGGKVADKKRIELTNRLNILKSFHSNTKKTEL
ncbi:unnamed protein product [Phaedon cochleariae]|uniref:Uncharacterized protein n=1 Tax=Phaedon cochleariae TaxID=80249 RepID=A0A9P0DIM7_PHACE|nr:unnamed protein product [Phaedon cochleariae]